jgi:phospholipid/cholesterol/gamma-HCH transport system ATP-binding protein
MVISVESIETRFGATVIHSSVTFSINKGELVAVIGGSGTGKTVLLREILGLHKPDSGEINLLGTNIWKESPAKVRETLKKVGVLFQSGALFSALSVAENIAVPLREQTTLPESIIQEIVDLRLLVSGLSLADKFKKPSELSGGMVKRAALARALALEPEVLFLDEPTSGLDPITARAFNVFIRKLAKNLGMTVFMITHDLATLSSVPDQIIVLGEGRVLAQGEYSEVARIDHPWIKSYFNGA